MTAKRGDNMTSYQFSQARAHFSDLIKSVCYSVELPHSNQRL